MSNSPFNPRVVATGVQGVPKSTGGKMAVCDVPVKYSMPCIVILVHGVNDVGEAYQNQEQGIIAGLNERMGRTEMAAVQNGYGRWRAAECKNARTQPGNSILLGI